MKNKSRREDTRINDPLVLILRNSIRSLNWIHDVHAKDMIQTHAGPMYPASVCEFTRALLMLI